MLGKFDEQGRFYEWNKDGSMETIQNRLDAEQIDATEVNAWLEACGGDLQASKLTEEQKYKAALYIQLMSDYEEAIRLHSTDNGWKPVVREERPECPEYGNIWMVPIDKGDYIALTWKTEQYNDTALNNAIQQAEEKIASTDYIITKTQEARLVGDPDPYDNFADIVAERKALRAKIAELKSYLSTNHARTDM